MRPTAPEPCPPGSARYWSWSFAAPDAKSPLLGVYALMAEWRGLVDPATEPSVAQIKLAWWRDEMGRVSSGQSLHPITRYLLALPGADPAALGDLRDSVDACIAQVAGVPLERADELEAHAAALYGTPLWVAARQASSESDLAAVRACTSALAIGEYLARAVADYGRETRAGRLPFPVDALLAAGIENEDLSQATPPTRLSNYLEQLRDRSAAAFATAQRALPTAERPRLRHLAVLATLGGKHLAQRRSPSGADFRLADLYNAWTAARRAAAAR